MLMFDDRLDEEHAAALEAIPPDLLDLSDIPKARAVADGLLEAMADMIPDIPGVTVADHFAPGPAGAPDVMVRVYRPDHLEGDLPALYWIHGGGMVLGKVDWDDTACKMLALAGDCVVASVEYRLAPEHPHPAPVEDCYAGLRWLSFNAPALDIDAGRVAIGGASAGGGLAAALALLVRDRGEIDLVWQMLIYPMIDDRNVTNSSHYVTHPQVWNRAANLAGWNALLAGRAGEPDVSPYAAAARAEDVSGLPPAYIAVGELDLFLDEDIEYAQRLLAAGVPTELHVYPKAFHGSDTFAPMTATSQQWTEDRNVALKAALHG